MIHIVTTLMHEVRPIIDFYHLKPAETHPYQIYQNENFSFIVSGVGKKQSASATIFLHEYAGNIRNRAWLNIGIGGHHQKPLGEGILAYKITDQASRKSWYPPQILKIDCPSESVLTVEKIESKYDQDVVYDMEAAGFYETACRFSTQELVHCFKIISDNSDASARKVSGTLVRNLVAQNLNIINSILKELSKLSAELSNLDSNSGELDQFLKHWHFTVTESHQLNRFLRRLKTLASKEHYFPKAFQCSKAKEVLKFLEHQIETLPVYL